jgi:hypothetical protein
MDKTKLIMAVVFILALIAGLFIGTWYQKDQTRQKQAIYNAYQTGGADMIVGIVQQVKSQGFVSLTVGNETMILTPYKPQTT